MTETLVKVYSEEQITEGLTVMAMWNGSSRKAAEILGIPPSTLQTWRNHNHA